MEISPKAGVGRAGARSPIVAGTGLQRSQITSVIVNDKVD